MGHHHHHHHHPPPAGSEGRLLVSIGLNLVITIAEVIGGILSGSLALLSDALHNFSDTSSLAITYAARRLGRRDPNARKTFGYKRAEILGAFVNLVTLVLIALFLLKEGVERLFAPEPIDGPVMLIVATVGLVANLLTALLLWRDVEGSLNIRSAFLHIVTDAVSSVGVVVGGLLIMLYEVYLVDPILTLVISVYILYQSYTMLRETTDILMEATPSHLDLHEISQQMASVAHVRGVHHLHVWQLDESQTALEAHIEIDADDLLRMESIKHALKKLLHDTYHITHSTLEFEVVPCDPAHDPMCYEQTQSVPEPHQPAPTDP